ncbi:MAG: putative zinc-binding metallopeptidase [Pelagibacteraceae bacterium]
MKKIFFIILLTLTISPLKADTIYELIKIPNLEIYDLKAENKLRYLYAKQPFTIGIDNNINCFNSNKDDLDQKYKLIKKNLDKYSFDFLKKINLKYIVLCEDLSISGINTAGIPDSDMKTLILDIKFNNEYFERVIHHEVFHVINDSFPDIFNKETWSSYNQKDFVYAECSTCTEKLGLDTITKNKGFISEYSQSTASEDMAEVYSHIITNEIPKNIDPILEKKISYIQSQILLIDDKFQL